MVQDVLAEQAKLARPVSAAKPVLQNREVCLRTVSYDSLDLTLLSMISCSVWELERCVCLVPASDHMI